MYNLDKMRKVGLIALLLFAVSCMAQELVPARREPIQKVQPNGDTLTVLLRGDEWHHWMMTTDRYRVQEGKKGYIYYSQRLLNGDVVASKQKAHNPGQRKKKEVCWLHRYGIAKVPPRIDPRLLHSTTKEAAEQVAAIRAKYISKPHKSPMQVNVRKTFPKVPVILVNFSNMAFSDDQIRTTVDSMFNAQDYVNPFGGHSGSIRQYFCDQSYGQYNPDFDIYGPVTLSQNYKYYGEDYGGNDRRPGYLVTEACALMNDSLDFAQYDTDQDGKVDLLYVICAGPAASDKDYINPDWIADPDNLIWPHYSTIDRVGCGENVRVFDGVKINDYEVSCELDGYYSFNPEYDSVAVAAGIGVACHEFSHGLGLPDQYNTTSGKNTNYEWDIMDYGCYNGYTYVPAGYSAYERWFMGWLTPRQLTEAENCTLPSLTQSGTAFLICPSGTHNLNGTNPSPASFYLLENRQPEKWDASLYGRGLILTQINYNAGRWTNNQPNNYTPLGIDIIEADGVPMNDLTGSKATDAFPAGATFYKGIENYPITNITQEENGNITFQFMGGKEPTAIDGLQCTMHNARFIYKGQIYIRKGGKTYNLLGHEVHLL